MLKVILIFIKTHIVTTAIATTIVIGTVVATPIIVENYKKENDVKQNVSSNDSVTVSSNNIVTDNEETVNNTVANENAIINENKEVTNNKITNNNSTKNDNSIEENKPNQNDEKPLTFKIEKIEREDDGIGKGIEYKVVPSYDKDGSKWTEEEKQEYEKMLQKAANMAKSNYDEAVEREKQILEEIEKSLEQN